MRASGRPKKKAAAAPTARRERRLRSVLDAAAKLIAKKGFDAATMRGIAAGAGLLAGSTYYHVPSKEAILIAVHAEGVRRIGAAVEAAVARASTPWERLEAACVAHLESLLSGSSYMRVIAAEFPRRCSQAARAALIAQRDGYEAIFAGLCAALPLPAGVDPRIFRLALLGSLNRTLSWYRPGRGTLSPADTARAILRLYRDRLDTAAGR